MMPMIAAHVLVHVNHGVAPFSVGGEVCEYLELNLTHSAFF